MSGKPPTRERSLALDAHGHFCGLFAVATMEEAQVRGCIANVDAVEKALSTYGAEREAAGERRALEWVREWFDRGSYPANVVQTAIDARLEELKEGEA